MVVSAPVMDQLTRDMLRREHARLRARAAFFHQCADEPNHAPDAREASRRVADQIGELIGKLAEALDGTSPAPYQARGSAPCGREQRR